MADELSFDGEIQLLMEAEPFRAFTISLTSGERHEIQNPDRLAIGQSIMTIFHHREGRTFFRKNQIVSVDTTE